MRFPTGVSRDRFNLITAVLAKHARLKVHAQLKHGTYQEAHSKPAEWSCTAHHLIWHDALSMFSKAVRFHSAVIA